ncbi:EamA family transporter RarD [Kushneria aurantia]|uniref:EamA family transporter RarD n=1 Tax=Kushneria aurantia TaxID=504092 RepID=A0ABV6G3A4_9GAMM|nr:EamA family transporter RarD [Kushneria aurantia]
MSNTREQSVGVATALGCFLLWGFLPLYFNLLNATSAWEILAQRVVWAAALLVLFALLTGRGARVMSIARDRRLLGALCLSALLISTNWGVFIWAVSNHHVLQSSLGYYINPLFNVVLGLLFFSERLRPLQLLAVGLAVAGVTIMVVGFGRVPWISLTLATSFGLYGALRKRIAVNSIDGLLIETVLLLPFALLWLGWLAQQEQLAFLHRDVLNDLLLVGCGLVTLLPLILFAMAARRLKLATLGLVQYITPTLHLLTGVLILGEPFNRASLITFAFIWAGLALYSLDALRAQRRVTSARRPAGE